jgi:hypothetical protein
VRDDKFASPGDGEVWKKTWIVGHSLITIETAARTGVSLTTSRRPVSAYHDPRLEAIYSLTGSVAHDIYLHALFSLHPLVTRSHSPWGSGRRMSVSCRTIFSRPTMHP